jgi:PAS domain S-box-containing protein
MKEKLLQIFVRQMSFSRLLVLFFAAILAGFVILSILFYRNNQAFNNGMALVTHTRTIIERTDSLLFLSQNLQWETRNYTLTGDSNAYQNYFSIRKAIHENTKHLVSLVWDNKNQHANAVQLRREIIQLIHFTDSSLQPRQPPGDVMNGFIKNVTQYVVLHDAINRQIKVIKSEENRLLAKRRADIYKTVASTYRIFVESGVLILILLTGTFAFVFYHFNKRRKAEKKLIESESKFQTIINSTKDLAIFMTDDSGHILDWYEGAHKIKGYSREEVIGKSVSIFYTPQAVAQGDPKKNLQIAAQQGSLETEGWRVRKDGSKFWADVLITAIYNDEGNLQGFTKVIRDFTVHKKAEDRIKYALRKEKELNQMKSNFVSMASHEFRTPLSTILSSISLLEQYRTTETQDKRDKHIQRIYASVGEMVSILEEFLSLEKMEEGKTEAKRISFNLKELVESVCAKFNNSLKAGQQIDYTHEGAEETLLDKNFTEHILTNLISNAVKYSPSGTKVFINTFVDTDKIQLRIKDFGIGISKEDQRHLFERFFRASNTGGIKGTGLGLHIVKRYIDLMEGTIRVESKADEGSEFTVILPSIVT